MSISEIWSGIIELFQNPKKKDEYIDLFDQPYIKVDSSDKNDCLIYIGCEGDEYLAKAIFKHFEKLQGYFKEVDCEFIFYPALQRDNEDSKRWISFSYSLSYYYPMWSGLEDDVDNELSATSPQQFYRSICEAYNVEHTDTPSFLLIKQRLGPKAEVTNYPIQGADAKVADKVLTDIKRCYLVDKASDCESTISFYNPDLIEKRKKKTTKKYDADDEFEAEASKISDEVISKVNFLLKNGQSKSILNIYNALLRQTKLHKPALFKQLNEIEIDNADVPLSRIVIDEKYRILLPEYNNMAIQMTPLPKTLYLLFLKHPEGIMLHDLVDHKKELLSIYGHITNSSDTREIRKRINDMVDIRKNSLNEKCSRIKEAFVVQLDDAIARNYYITGYRGEVKRIKLSLLLRTYNK